MECHNAWIVQEKREDNHLIPLTWAYRKNLGSNNVVSDFKVCICVQGFCQTFGLNYFSKCALTGKPCSFCLLISFAVNKGCKIHQLDVKSTFLTCPLEDKVTAIPPPKYDGRKNFLFELKRAVYGLWKAP
jgi:hypothetical protein